MEIRWGLKFSFLVFGNLNFSYPKGPISVAETHPDASPKPHNEGGRADSPRKSGLGGAAPALAHPAT